MRGAFTCGFFFSIKSVNIFSLPDDSLKHVLFSTFIVKKQYYVIRTTYKYVLTYYCQ